MEPYYKDKYITLYKGNCLDILDKLETESVDAIITDPPYNSGGASLSVRQQSTKSKYTSTKNGCIYDDFLGDNKDDHSFRAWERLWIEKCYRIAKEGASFLHFTDWRQLSNVTDTVQIADFLYKGLLVWNKRNSRPNKGAFAQDAEFIVYSKKGNKKLNISCHRGVFSYANVSSKKRYHQTQKPIELMQDLCKVANNEKDSLVLDPFAGSGSTLIACKNLGIKAIGIERSENYCKKIVEHIQNNR